MDTQHPIKRTLSQPENLELISQMLGEVDADGKGEVRVRTTLADTLCEDRPGPAATGLTIDGSGDLIGVA